MPVSLLGTLLLLAPRALAGGTDFSEEAEEAMRLSFDMDTVEGMLQAPSPAAVPQVGLVGVPPAAPLPLEPNSDAVAVTVFQDRALVTRVLTARLQEGANSVVFEGLPLGVSSDSLHAFVETGRARIVGVEVVSGRGKVEETERVVALKKELEGYTAELGEVRDRIESLLAQRAYLRTTMLAGPGENRPQPGLDQVKGSLAWIGDTERSIAAQLRKEQDRAAAFDEKIAPLLVKLANPMATGQQIRVDLDAAGPGEFQVGLRYQVAGARWWPAYNARLDPATGRVAVEYNGIVAQATGETWDGVRLELSTANPSGSGDLPELEPWYLGRDTYDPGDYAVTDNLMGGRGYYAEADAAPTVVADPIHTPPSETEMSASVQGAGVVVFAIPGQRTVAGDGSEQRLPVGTQTFTATLELACVPKLVPEVFRKGRIRYDGTAPLLPGPVATFVGGDYVGSGTLKTVVPGEELSLAFGTEEQVRVERTLVSRSQESAGRKMNRWTFHFRIKVTNFSGKEQVVDLSDQVPVSEVEKVIVKVLEVSDALPPTATDGPGMLRWRLTVPPGKDRTVDLRFSVTAPEDVPQVERMMAF